MSRRCLGRSALLLLALISCPVLIAQQEKSIVPPADWEWLAPQPMPMPHIPLGWPVAQPRWTHAPETTLENMIHTAGMIFSGSVIAIAPSGSPAEIHSSSTTITFHVEHAIRGATPGQILTIREWAGLWSRGERYRIGEHLLLFLYPPSKLGFTSPVAGLLGRFPVTSTDKITLDAYRIAAFAHDPVLGGKQQIQVAEFERTLRRFLPEEP